MEVTTPSPKAESRNVLHKNNLSQTSQKTNTRSRSYKGYNVTTAEGDTFTLWLSGRVAWALRELCKAGSAGITSFENPAPRLSAYIHVLRHECGVEIETEIEAHKGDFEGFHGRYRLACRVDPIMGEAA